MTKPTTMEVGIPEIEAFTGPEVFDQVFDQYERGDLVVSTRQKHNGMSWSADGSTSLATLTSLHRNDEQMNWLRRRHIQFAFPELKQVQPAA